MAPTLNTRTTEVVLFQGDDLDKIDAARTAVQQARESKAAQSMNDPKPSGRLNDVDPVKAAAEAFDALVAECAERGVRVPVHALPRKQYRELVLKHPPRADNDTDAMYGFNSDDMADDLVPQSVPEEFRGDFLDSLSDADFSTIYGAAVRLNQGVAPNPKASMSSALGLTGAES